MEKLFKCALSLTRRVVRLDMGLFVEQHEKNLSPLLVKQKIWIAILYIFLCLWKNDAAHFLSLV